ncbi:rod shape-determining protein RodA [Dasania sp. GY-MA-18]|uniref:Peptidoglycan glycosyltransferase MrdB n=1 Tax=Dasania phycosphaerae TaxID=2950436 RepID=A0A9J6RG57_9GAMM|nr:MULTISPECIES: rod shape-determining protein RodA [Dasania]MCR8921210.1 rod shape-determining protein RodA [Dasania sp. GY-MA-18]MCZ0863638.1 rod shape-determining protein RodA [Dasania phycosphaerae]MCZ0867366.1 rod shape-determining protein RodA [Dasania phycosphaerae]
MSHSDFVRQMPNTGSQLARRNSIWQRLHIDLPLLFLLMLLTGGGLFVLYSASGQDISVIYKQSRFFLLAYAVMFFIAQFDVERIKRLAPPAYVACVILLILVPFIGVGAKGAQRWLSLGGFRFQPSELMKVVLPMAVAWYFSKRVLPPSFRHVIVSLVIVFVPTLLIAKQPDLGTSILIAASGLFVLFLAGIPWSYIASALGLVLMAAYPMWHYVLHGYQKQRILTMLNPESDKLGAGWNIIQSKTAIGSGGFEGKGWLNGTQSQLDFLPESHTDFIIAVLAEELGLKGVLVLMALYLLIIGRGLWIGYKAQHCFGRLLAGSITLTFFVYVFVNMGMVSGLLPVVGVPLPLVSQGGTSIVSLMVGFGLLMAISTEKRIIDQ